MELLYFAKEVKPLMKKKMFEIVETKCPSVIPSIPYKSIAVIQYITSSEKQEKNEYTTERNRQIIATRQNESH